MGVFTNKKLIKFFFILTLVFPIASCNNKELELREKELLLKERQLQLDSINLSNKNEVSEISLDFSEGRIDNKFYRFIRYKEGKYESRIIFYESDREIRNVIFEGATDEIHNIKYINNRYFYFYTFIPGGSSGDRYYYHYLIDLKTNKNYKKELICHESNMKDCELNNILDIEKEENRFDGLSTYN